MAGERPVVVQVTVVASGHAPPVSERLARLPGRLRARAITFAVLVAAAAAVAGVSRDEGGAAGRIGRGQLRAERSLARAPLASAHSARCFGLAISLHDPRFARADFDRALCGARAGRRPIATFHRVEDESMPMLDDPH